MVNFNEKRRKKPFVISDIDVIIFSSLVRGIGLDGILFLIKEVFKRMENEKLGNKCKDIIEKAAQDINKLMKEDRKHEDKTKI